MMSSYTRILLLLIILLLPKAVLAQVKAILSGTVTEQATGDTLAAVIVTAKGSTALSTLTDMNGHYQLELDAGNYEISFLQEAIGKMESIQLRVEPGEQLVRDVKITGYKNLMKTTVVSGSRFGQRLEEQILSLEVVKANTINNKNTTTIETALEAVPGLCIIDNDPQIRGGSGFTFGVGSRVAIVVDGIPLLSGDAGRPEWSYIPVENIEQIEVLKGNSTVLYGASALSGVISIRTAYPRSKPKTLINYSLGAYSAPKSPARNWYGNSIPGFTNLNFLHSRIIHKNLDLVVGGNLNADQGYIGPPPPAPDMPEDLRRALLINDTIPTYSNKDMLRLRARLNFNLRYRSRKVEGLSYGINGNGMLQKTNMVFAWLSDSNGLYQGYPGAVFLERQSIFNVDPFVRYSAEGRMKHSFSGRIFHTDNVISNNQSNRGTLYFGEYQLQKRLEPFDLTITGGAVGSISQSYAALYASSGSPNNKITNLAGYIQLDKKLFKRLNLCGGFRYEYFKMNAQDAVMAPVVRLGANLQLTEGTFLRASFGQGFRYPTITERFIFTKAGLFGVFSNPDLKPEKSRNIEAGIKQGFKVGSLQGYLDVAAFQQNYQNTIEYLFGTWEPTVALVGFKFVNTGDSRIRGVDLSLAGKADIGKTAITFMTGYTYIVPVSLTPDYIYATTKPVQPGGQGEQLSYNNSSLNPTGNILKYRFQHMIKGDIEASYHNISLGITYRFYSRMSNIDKAFEGIQELTHNASPYLYEIQAINFWESRKTINIFDARLSYQITKKQKLSVICNNIFNTAYALRPLKIESPRTTALQYAYEF